MREVERSQPAESGLTPEARPGTPRPPLGREGTMIGSLALEGSPIWRAACGRRAALRWPGHLSSFEVYNGEERLELSDFSASGLGVISASARAPIGVGNRID